MNKLLTSYFKTHRLKQGEVSKLKKIDPTVHSGRLFYEFDRFCQVLNELPKESVITIYPDYDTDGITGGLIALSILTTLGFKTHVQPPNSDDGYGLTETAVDKIIAKYPATTHIFTVDNGINTKKAVDYAKSRNILTIITDHHTPQPENHPDQALVIISPNRSDVIDTYPYKSIAGAQVVYKVLLAYVEKYRPELIATVKRLEGISSISIISDMMPVLDENRVLLKRAEEQLSAIIQLSHETFCDPLASFEMKMVMSSWKTFIGKITKESYQVDYQTIGWSISPKLNAVSRMISDSALAFNFFLTNNPVDLKTMIELQTQQRQEVQYAVRLLAPQYEEKEEGYVCLSVGLRSRLCGLVANNIVNLVHKPVVVLNEDLAGSSRSPETYNVFQILDELHKEYPSYFKSVGGHAQACGLSLNELTDEELWTFIHSFQTKCKHVRLDGSQDGERLTQKAITLDGCDLPSEREVDEFLVYFDELKPYPTNLPLPRFKVTLTPDEFVPMIMGSDQTHLKLKLLNGKLDIVAFGQAEKFNNQSHFTSVTAIGELDVNFFRGQSTVQLKASDLIFHS